jgi:hypothetical protein
MQAYVVPSAQDFLLGRKAQHHRFRTRIIVRACKTMLGICTHDPDVMQSFPCLPT